MAAPVVEVERLRREFAGRPRRSEPVVALDGLSLSVAAGELHGLLGPNRELLSYRRFFRRARATGSFDVG
jgi:ABC-type branched-subunit amino acid transport system ATPase component